MYQQRGGYDGFDRGVGQSKRTAFRVVRFAHWPAFTVDTSLAVELLLFLTHLQAVLGLHEKTSWQDLKDFGRRGAHTIVLFSSFETH